MKGRNPVKTFAILSAVIFLAGFIPVLTSAQLAPPLPETEIDVQVAPPIPTSPFEEPLAVITPRTHSYSYTTSPVFDIKTGTHTHFKVELTLAKHFFDPNFGNRITSATDVDQNFYASPVATSTGETDPFTVPNNVWRNLRGSVVFYRVITYSNAQGANPLYSTTNSNWAQAPAINRTDEGWYGLPLNDQAVVRNNVRVVTNGELNTAALASDYGPRFVLDSQGNEVRKATKFHPGLDIPVVEGTPVYAFSAGRVVNNLTVSLHRMDIDHGGFRSGYVHLQSAVVDAGDQVVTGQLIGYSGDWSGGQDNGTGDHLHFDSGYPGSQEYRNPLEMLRYIDQFEQPRYLSDAYTRNRPIDVEPATGDQHKVLVGFGITTDLDKDLNYVSVAVDPGSLDEREFVLDYDCVASQSRTNEGYFTGVITLRNDEDCNGGQFRIRRLYQPSENESVYRDTNLAYPFYVTPAETDVNLPAHDYFFYVWETAAYAANNYAGPHDFIITLKEIDNVPQTQTIRIGPELSLGDILFDGSDAQFEFQVTNHDVMAGDIELQLINLPAGWSGQLSQTRVSIPANGQTTFNLTLTAPGTATAQPLVDARTSVIATFSRIPDLRDGRVLCDAGGGGGQLFRVASSTAGECGSSTKVRIDSPADGATVTEGSTEMVTVWAEFGASDVRLEVNGSEQPLESSDNLNTYIFRWDVPDGAGKPYDLQAFASVNGETYESQTISVTSIADVEPGEIVVTITDPEANSDVILNKTKTVKVTVSAPVEAVIEQVELSVNEGQEVFVSTSAPWTFDWIPTIEGINHLKATVVHDGGIRGPSEEITVYGEQEIEPVIVNPAPGSQLSWNQLVKILVLSPLDGPSIDVRVSREGIFHYNLPGSIVYTDLNGAVWEYDWWPQGEPGSYELQVVDGFNPETSLGDPISVNLSYESDVTDPTVIFLNPADGRDFSKRFPVIVKATDNHGINDIAVDIVNQSNPTEPIPSEDRLERCGAHCYQFVFVPTEEGDYVFTARAVDTVGNKGTASIHVGIKNLGDSGPSTHPQNTIETPINQYARMIRYEGLGKDIEETIYGDKEMIYDTGISALTEECAIFGFAALNGDIYEYIGDIVKVLLYENSGQWRLKVNFRSQVWKSEDWDVNVLCIDRNLPTGGGPSPSVITKTFKDLGDNVKDFDTGYSADQYVCGIAGFAALDGDIQEHGRGDIIQVYLEPGANRHWLLRADFRTESGDPEDPENWEVRILCVSREHASLNGHERGKTYFLETYRRLGDNIRFNTEIPVNRYVCGIAGFAARNGDINEDDRGDIFQVYAYESGDSSRPTWHIRADFRTHKGTILGGDGHENWDVDLLCIERSGFEVPQNTSFEAMGNPPCAEEEMVCQVLEDEFIDFRGTALVDGGGFSESYDHAYTACDWDEPIEVYINDRDGGTGKPRWSYPPDLCLSSGDTITLQSGSTYDFRGVGVEGGETYSFRLKNPLDAPVLTAAYPKLFPAPYGPGMAMEWEATLHPLAAFYEIQFSEDGGTTWHVYTRSRDVSYGGWMNHHSTLNCGFGFTRCLKRRQIYNYRLRVLDAQQNPLTDWSNTLTATSFDWPAHVRLANPSPPGPYLGTTEVSIQLQYDESYGQGMDLQWMIRAYNGAMYTIVFGCENGSLSYVNATTCKLRIRDESNGAYDAGTTKLASLAPETSIDVIVVGTDSLGFTDSAKVTLDFVNNPCPKDGCVPK